MAANFSRTGIELLSKVSECSMITNIAVEHHISAMAGWYYIN